MKDLRIQLKESEIQKHHLEGRLEEIKRQGAPRQLPMMQSLKEKLPRRSK